MALPRREDDLNGRVAPSDVRARYTVELGPSSIDDDCAVLVGAPRTALSEVVARARPLLETLDGPVRLVANGVTLVEQHPEWLRAWARSPLRLTELDCYLPDDRAAAVTALNATLARWLDETLAPVLPDGVAPSTVFWSSACDRFFDTWADDWVRAAAVCEAHAGARIIALVPEWHGSGTIAALGGEARRRSRFPSLLRPLAVAAVGGAALVRRVHQFVRERSTRAELARRQRALRGEPAPDTWIGVVASWPRASRPVLEGFAVDARRAGARVGVLVLHSLEAGLRTSEVSGPRRDALLPVLDDDALAGAVARVDQAVSATTTGELIASLARGAAAVGRVAWRARRWPRFELGGVARDADWPLAPVAKLLSVEVLRVVEAADATRRLFARHDFAGATVVYPHITQANDCVGNQLLQRAGARTVELVHGISSERWHVGAARTFTTVKALWSQPEAAVLAKHTPGQLLVGGYMPRAAPVCIVRASRGGRPLRVLVASSYLSVGWALDPMTREHYQAPLLADVLDGLRAHDATGSDVRWRPHPGDDPHRIASTLARFPSLKRSGSATLEEDLAWCDLLVTSLSSVAIEGLRWDVPVFVHEIPLWDPSSYIAFDARRRFGLRASFADLVGDVLDQPAADALTIERETLRRLFPPDGVPRRAWDDFGVRYCAASFGRCSES
jgi:hypothetical protein